MRKLRKEINNEPYQFHLGCDYGASLFNYSTSTPLSAQSTSSAGTGSVRRSRLSLKRNLFFTVNNSSSTVTSQDDAVPIFRCVEITPLKIDDVPGPGPQLKASSILPFGIAAGQQSASTSAGGVSVAGAKRRLFADLIAPSSPAKQSRVSAPSINAPAGGSRPNPAAKNKVSNKEKGLYLWVFLFFSSV